MCGLAFLYAPEMSSEDAHQRMEAALARITHRGPDGYGLTLQGGAYLGHRRLSIIDLAGGQQPIGDAEKRRWMVFNGEIYNYQQLRVNLSDHWHWRSGGDTEVLLAGLCLQGESFFRHMEGMWALALWDADTGSLLLARDRMGKKPLYYASWRNGFAVASELPALRALTPFRWTEDTASTADYLRYGFQLPGTTAYAEAKELPPGHSLRWSQGTGIRLHQYWSLAPSVYQGTRVEAARELRNRLQTAVRRRLVADVEIGTFLSGGVDSSLIAALAQQEMDHPLQAFTMGFSDESFDERPYARLAARHIGVRHLEDICPVATHQEVENLIQLHVGQPFADASILPTSEISRLAAKHVKVALSGDGGDELFSGYQRYQARQILRWYTRLPAPLRRLTESAIRLLPEPMAHHSRSLLKKAHLFTHLVQRIDSESPYFSARMFSDHELRGVAPDIAQLGHEPPGLLRETALDDLPRMMFADALVYLPQDILTKVDRASMAHGLEVRAPFLDRDVVEFAFSLHPHWHRHGLSGKRMLKAAFPNLLPGEIWRRRKQGFGVPVHAWMRGALGEYLAQLLEVNPGPLEPQFVRQMLNEHRQGTRDHGLRLWSLYIYLTWKSAAV